MRLSQINNNDRITTQNNIMLKIASNYFFLFNI